MKYITTIALSFLCMCSIQLYGTTIEEFIYQVEIYVGILENEDEKNEYKIQLADAYFALETKDQPQALKILHENQIDIECINNADNLPFYASTQPIFSDENASKLEHLLGKFDQMQATINELKKEVSDSKIYHQHSSSENDRIKNNISKFEQDIAFRENFIPELKKEHALINQTYDQKIKNNQDKIHLKRQYNNLLQHIEEKKRIIEEKLVLNENLKQRLGHLQSR